MKWEAAVKQLNDGLEVFIRAEKRRIIYLDIIFIY